MNLINDAWIPVRRRNGEKIKIAPWQITEGSGTENEVVELAAVRPDFNGALVQFLIGLLQTTCVPKNTGEWRRWLNNPPDPGQLKKRFETVAYAFNLDGDGPRFMQEARLDDKEKRIEHLLIDTPGKKKIDENTDFFIKRNRIDKICSNCAAMSLYSLQINAPNRGAGHQTYLRASGPITSIFIGDSIYKTCWQNILEESSLSAYGNICSHSNIFPWMGEIRISIKNLTTTIQDIHPFQLYWPMPRRTLLLFNKISDICSCDLCSEDLKSGDSVVHTYFNSTQGIKYDIFNHPLSPVNVADGKSVSMQPKGKLGYKHWLGLIYSEFHKKRNQQSAKVITLGLNKVDNPKIWVFGYEIVPADTKVKQWHEGIMPAVLIEEKFRESFVFYATNIIKVAEQIANNLAWRIKEALYNLRLETNKNKDFVFVKNRFWESTEAEFYDTLNNLRDFIVKNEGNLPQTILKRWLNYLAKTAEEIFDDVTRSGEFSGVDPARVAIAWNKLKWGIYSDRTKEILGLPVEPKPVNTEKLRVKKVRGR